MINFTHKETFLTMSTGHGWRSIETLKETLVLGILWSEDGGKKR